MAELIRQRFQGNVHGEHECGARVAQFMNRPVPESGLLRYARNPLAEVARVQGSSVGGGENEDLVVTPRVTAKQDLSLLIPAMTFEEIDEWGRQVKRTPTPLGLQVTQVHAGVIANELTTDRYHNRVLFEFNIRPRETDDLTSAQPEQ